MDPQLVDRIYECTFVPDQWPGALGELAAIATARTGFLFVSKGEIHRFVGSTDFGLEAVRADLGRQRSAQARRRAEGGTGSAPAHSPYRAARQPSAGTDRETVGVVSR